MRRRLGVAALVLAASGAGTVACSSQPRQIEADYATYDTVSALAGESGLVIRGTVDSVVAREVDGGGDPEVADAEGEPAGIPMVFYRIDVDEVVAGDAPSQVVVAWPDSGEVVFEGATPVAPGQSLVLFLQHRDIGNAPGITSVPQHYVPVSGDSGVFDVVGQEVVARSAEIRGLDPSRRGRGEGLLRASISELRRAVSSAPGRPA